MKVSKLKPYLKFYGIKDKYTLSSGGGLFEKDVGKVQFNKHETY